MVSLNHNLSLKLEKGLCLRVRTINSIILCFTGITDCPLESGTFGSYLAQKVKDFNPILVEAISPCLRE